MITKGDSRDLVGKAVGVSGFTVDCATKVLKAAEPDPVKNVMEKQNRRDLTATQRAMIGARAEVLREKLTAEAKARHAEAVAKSNRARAAAPSPSVELVPPMDTNATKTRDQLGKLVGVTGRSIDNAAKVLKKGVPELIKAVEEDRIPVTRAAKIADQALTTAPTPGTPMKAPELKRVFRALESIGLHLGDPAEVADDDDLATIVEVAARNHALGRERLRREMAAIRGNQRANLRGGFTVGGDLPIE